MHPKDVLFYGICRDRHLPANGADLLAGFRVDVNLTAIDVESHSGIDNQSPQFVINAFCDHGSMRSLNDRATTSRSGMRQGCLNCSMLPPKRD